VINEKDIALIDTFIAGELIGNDKTDFQNRVKRDLEFAKAVRQQIHAVEHLEIFGAISMGTALRADMQQWKSQGGYKPYKSTMGAQKMLVKVVASIVVVGAIAGALWYFLLREKSEIPTPEPVPAELPEALYEPAPPATEELDSLSLTELKTSEEQIADMQLDVQDPTSFYIIELKEENGVYTYQIEYDGIVKEIQSKDPDLDDTLMRMANESIAENDRINAENQKSQKRTYQPKAQVKEEPVVEEKKPEPKPPATKPKPTPRKTKEKVVDDFPY
jgi:hypothetical protein